MLSTESRMRGDMQVRFGGRYGKTYCRKAVRRSVPSLRLGRGGNIIALAGVLYASEPTTGRRRFHYRPCNAVGAVRFRTRRPIAEKQREGTDRCTPIFVAFIDRSRAPYPLRHTASSFGIARLFTAARYRSGGCLHLLSGDTLYDQWQKIFRHRISERCRRMGVALGMLQRKCIAQTDYDDRQLHRYGNRLRGVHGFSLLSFDEAPRPTTHRRNSIKLGRQSSESASVSRTPFDDSCFLRQ